MHTVKEVAPLPRQWVIAALVSELLSAAGLAPGILCVETDLPEVWATQRTQFNIVKQIEVTTMEQQHIVLGPMLAILLVGVRVSPRNFYNILVFSQRLLQHKRQWSLPPARSSDLNSPTLPPPFHYVYEREGENAGQCSAVQCCAVHSGRVANNLFPHK
jgi:hypothetical protein